MNNPLVKLYQWQISSGQLDGWTSYHIGAGLLIAKIAQWVGCSDLWAVLWVVIIGVAWEIFESTGVTARFGVPDERFQAFLGRMELLYSVENPYRCALHAAVRPDDIAPANYPPASSPKLLFQSRSSTFQENVT